VIVPDLGALVESELAEGLLGPGCQVYASVEGEVVLDVSLGVDAIGRPVTRDTLFAVYCAGKPVLAVALACLVEDGEVSFDDQLGDVIDGPLPAPIASLVVADLLSHTAGVHRLPQREYMSAPAQWLDALVEGVPIPTGWQPGVHVGYSEVAAWHLLGRAVDSLAADGMRTFVRRRVLIPIGIEDELVVGGMSEDDYTAMEPRFGVNLWLTGESSDPLLMERTRRLRCATNPSVGTSATVRGLGRFYDELLRINRGGGTILSAASVEALVTTRVSGPDQMMLRECSYGLGFMTDLPRHHFGSRCSPTAFGHSGNGGMTAGLCDPETGIVIAYHFGGRIDGETAVEVLRPIFLNRMIAALVGDR
jgi:CubicO group peptidase (beta-lactamase class C family)